MKIAFPDESGGGSKTWISLFSRFLESNGHQITTNLTDSYDLLINMADFLPVERLTEIRASGKKILYRMDGLYWDYLCAKNEADAKNANLKQVMLCSDAIVFQSLFVKSVVCRELLVEDFTGEVIYNGVDQEFFRPDGTTVDRPTDKKVIIAAGNWGPPRLALPMLENYLKVAEMLLGENMEFRLCGSAPPAMLEYLRSIQLPPNTGMEWLGRKEPLELAEYFRTADLLLYLRPNDPCPHLILEAMSCSIPIVGLQSGSLPELLGDAALLGPCENTITHFPQCDLNDICQKIRFTLERSLEFKEKMQRQSAVFAWDKMGERYLDKINRMMN